ncbi:MAG TPA: hypothetical protein VHM90_19030, partial [Phycisphaerae bacterium]|nr:hypothetical protein [Phycisphaerae bacterium]
MRIRRLFATLAIGGSLVAFAGSLLSCNMNSHERPELMATAQVPRWSDADMQFYLHGSMSTEVVPETVMRAFFATYPDIYPTRDFSHIGAIPDSKFGWPVGFSRADVPHLGGLTSVGINCAVCHTSEISAPGESKVRVLGLAGNFDAEAFFGGIVISGFRCQDPANMKKFLWAYLAENDAAHGRAPTSAQGLEFAALWDKQSAAITAAMAADPSGARGAGPGGLQ